MTEKYKELEAEVIGYKASLERANFRMCEKDARIHELTVENEKLRDENAKLKTFNRGDFEEFADILDKHDFFCQRAGYESWFEKPKAVQDKDIENRKLDYERMKFLLHRFHEELVTAYENVEFWKNENTRLESQALVSPITIEVRRARNASKDPCNATSEK